MTTVIKEIIQAMLKDLTNEQLIKLKKVLKEKGKRETPRVKRSYSLFKEVLELNVH